MKRQLIEALHKANTDYTKAIDIANNINRSPSLLIYLRSCNLEFGLCNKVESDGLCNGVNVYDSLSILFSKINRVIEYTDTPKPHVVYKAYTKYEPSVKYIINLLKLRIVFIQELLEYLDSITDSEYEILINKGRK